MCGALRLLLHAPKSDVRHPGVRRRAAPGRWAVTFAVTDVAEKRAAFGDTLLLLRINWIPASRWASRVVTRWFTGALHEGVRAVPIAAPLPDIADHVVKLVAVWRKRFNRGCSCKAVSSGVAIREISLPGIGHVFSIDGIGVAPGKFLLFESAARGELPFGLGG